MRLAGEELDRSEHPFCAAHREADRAAKTDPARIQEPGKVRIGVELRDPRRAAGGPHAPRQALAAAQCEVLRGDLESCRVQSVAAPGGRAAQGPVVDLPGGREVPVERRADRLEQRRIRGARVARLGEDARDSVLRLKEDRGILVLRADGHLACRLA